MKMNEKTKASFAEAAKYMRKCADLMDKLGGDCTDEGESTGKAKKRRICD